MNLNRELHEALGYCWHEERPDILRIDDVLTCRKCGAFFIGDDMENPDYVADPRLVIREMEKRGCLDKFICYVCGIHHLQWNRNVTDFTKLVAIDTTGKLAQLALDWLRKEG